MGIGNFTKEKEWNHDLLVTIVGQLLVLVISFAVNKILAVRYTNEEYAVYGILRRLASVVTYVSLMAMGIAVPKYLAEYKEKKDDVTYSLFHISSLSIVGISTIIVSILVYGFRDNVSVFFLGDNKYFSYILPALVFACGSTFLTFVYSFFRGAGNFIRYSTSQIFTQILLLLALCITGSKIESFLLLSGLIFILYSALSLFKPTKKSLHFMKHSSVSDFRESMKVLLKYGVPRVPGEFVLFAYNLVPLSICAHKFGLVETSYLSASITINNLITPFFSFAGIVLLPIASKVSVNKKYDDLSKKVKNLGMIYLFVGVLGVVFVNIFGTSLIKIVLSESYLSALNIIRIMVLSVIPYSIYLLLRNPIDGLSIFPYNTISLSITFAITCTMMFLSSSILQCVWAFFFGYVILACLSFFFWKLVKNEDKNKQDRD